MTHSRLEFCEVVKHYRGGVRAVDGVSMRVEPGQLVALYGPSGSGKTTLLMMAGGYLQPDGGSVLFDGQDLARSSSKQLTMYQRRDVGLVKQGFHLRAGVTAVDNVTLKLLADRVPINDARRRATAWLDRVGLGERITHTPEQLSGGEQHRVALARALVNEPRLILADEPTAYLDRQRGAEILRLLSRLAHEQPAAVLLVTHDPEAAAIADRMYPLSDGRLVPQESTTSSLRPTPAAQGGMGH